MYTIMKIFEKCEGISNNSGMGMFYLITCPQRQDGELREDTCRKPQL
jgi:hypothetical protein